MKRLFLCLLLFTGFACDNTLSTPEDILPERTMISILSELQVAESKVKNLRISSDSAKQVFSIYEVKILHEHNVTAPQYLRSYEYYLDNHRLMSRVHQAVLDTLMRRQTKVEAMPDVVVKALPLSPKDSLAQDSLLASQKDSVLLQELQQKDSLALKKAVNDSIRKQIRKKPLRKRDPVQQLPRNEIK